MGQVYRATDTTLGRQVAIKILPDAFASDPERMARFEREAKTLASLNHPHIAAIYGFEKSGGLHALVMELVEGDDLSQRIARGAIPGFWAVRGDDGVTYDQLNLLPPAFQQENLRVQMVIRVRTDAASIHMVGPIVDILQIRSGLVTVHAVDRPATGHSLRDSRRTDSGRSRLDAGNRTDWAVGVRRTGAASRCVVRARKMKNLPLLNSTARLTATRRMLRLRLPSFSDGGFNLSGAAQAHNATMWNGNHITARNQCAAQSTLDWRTV